MKYSTVIGLMVFGLSFSAHAGPFDLLKRVKQHLQGVCSDVLGGTTQRKVSFVKRSDPLRASRSNFRTIKIGDIVKFSELFPTFTIVGNDEAAVTLSIESKSDPREVIVKIGEHEAVFFPGNDLEISYNYLGSDFQYYELTSPDVDGKYIVTIFYKAEGLAGLIHSFDVYYSPNRKTSTIAILRDGGKWVLSAQNIDSFVGHKPFLGITFPKQ